MTSPLTAWLADPREDRGIRFSDGDGWAFRPYAAVAADVAAAAARLRTAGVRPGDVVCLVLGQGPEFVGGFFGALAVGAAACAVAPPNVFVGAQEYVAHAAALLRQAAPAAVLTDTDDEPLVRAALAEAHSDARVVLAATGKGDETVEPVERGAGDRVLVQFTSGSSGRPRAVTLSHDNLAGNIETIRRWLRMTPDDVTCTWLPVYHDMGLVGCLLTPVVNTSDTWVMRPEEFVRRPLRWLECLGRHGATLTAAPSFGYGYVAKHVRAGDLDGYDFGHVRVCIAGAERIDPGALAAFARLTSPRGLRTEALTPAYGLAEATLTVTGSGIDEQPYAVRIGDHTRATVDDPAIADGGPWLTSSGRAHPGTAVTIEDDDGRAQPDGTVGEIVVTGPSVTATGTGSEVTRLDGGRLRTGDAGFLLDGDLFVVGRMGDRITVRGRHVYAEEIEDRLVAQAGVPRGRCVVLPGRYDGSVVALVEAAPAEWVDRARGVLRGLAGTESVEVRAVPRGTIPRTSSGKPRRRAAWQRLDTL